MRDRQVRTTSILLLLLLILSLSASPLLAAEPEYEPSYVTLDRAE